MRTKQKGSKHKNYLPALCTKTIKTVSATFEQSKRKNAIFFNENIQSVEKR